MANRADETAKRCKEGDFVEIHYIVLPAGERSPDVPDDTKKVPLECWVRGWALFDGQEGSDMEVETPAGRRVRGTLSAAEVGFYHTFGPAVPELAGAGKELREALAEAPGGGKQRDCQ